MTIWQKTHWNTDQQDQAGYPALYFEESPPVESLPDTVSRFPYLRFPYKSHRKPHENNRYPSMRRRMIIW